MIRVAYQGEPGAYGEEAGLRFFAGEQVEACPMPTFSAVYDSVASGATDAGVLPLENSLAGTVGDALDALATGSLTVIGEVLEPIHHQLLVVPGVSLPEIEHVMSHWQALSQCHRFLSRRGWHLIPAADTAGAARQLALEPDRRVAVIASERAADLYGLEVAARDIEDAPHNVTRFAVISRTPRGRDRRPARPWSRIVGRSMGVSHHVRDRPQAGRPGSRAVGPGERGDQPLADRVQAVGGGTMALSVPHPGCRRCGDGPVARRPRRDAAPHQIDAGARLLRRRLTYRSSLAAAATAARSPRR